MNNTNSVYIVILNWNGWQDSCECVESCLKLSYQNYQILIVDNGSTNDSEYILRGKFPDIEFIQTGENLGFAGGNNVRIRYALENGADYIWLLNNDTVVDPEALTELVKVVRATEKCGIVGSKIYFYDKPEILWFAGGRIFYPTATCEHIGHLEKDDKRFDQMMEVDYITGCSLLITREAIDASGLMDEKFFLLFEESDWNIRVQNNGYKTVYVPASKVWHKVSRSLGEYSPIYYYYLFRNSLLFIAKHKPWYLLSVILKRTKDALVFLKKGKRAHAEYAFKGMLDFGLRRFGISRYQ